MRCCEWIYPVRWAVAVGGTGSLAWNGPATRRRPDDLPATWGALPRDVEPTKILVARIFAERQAAVIVSRTTDVSYMALKTQPASP